MTAGRRAALGLALAAVLVALAPPAAADEELPSSLAAQLLWKIAAFDKGSAARRAARPRVLVVHRRDDERSIRSANQIAAALVDTEPGAQVEIVAYGTAAALLAAVDARLASIVVLTPGLEGDGPDIAAAAAGKDVLTLATTGTLVERGAVAGVELRSGKPKVVVHLSRARAQGVTFRAELLSLARIVG